jgi:hypothetical protein
MGAGLGGTWSGCSDSAGIRGVLDGAVVIRRGTCGVGEEADMRKGEGELMTSYL